MYRDLYSNIASYLTDFDIVKTLEGLEHESTDMVRKKDVAQSINKLRIEIP